MIFGRSWCCLELKIASSVIGLHSLNEIVTLYVPIMRDVTLLASHDAIFVALAVERRVVTLYALRARRDLRAAQ